MKASSYALACLVLLVLGCGGGDTAPTNDGDSGLPHDRADGGDGDGDGDALEYPGFVPKECSGDGCPSGSCGPLPPDTACDGLYGELFDADYADYCAKGDAAAYCIRSEPADFDLNTPPGITFCITCVDGTPTFERCPDEGIQVGPFSAECN